VLSSAGVAKRHQQDVHQTTEDGKQECYLCGKAARNLNALKAHLRRNHAIYLKNN
jgi:hypothetical protein